MHQYKQINNFFYDISSKPLGEGSFGQVYIGYDSSKENMKVAIKVIPKVKAFKDDYHIEILQREIKILSLIDSDHIVKLHTVEATKNNIYIILEYCNGGTLRDLMTKKGNFSEKEALSMIKQIALAFTSVEEKEIRNEENELITIMHRDLKPENILLHNSILKVGDFGFARMVETKFKEELNSFTNIGTPLYASPEILAGDHFSVKCDVWSAGIIFFELLSGSHPWPGSSSPADLYSKILTEKPIFPKDISLECLDLIKRMLEPEDSDRIGWESILGHNAIKKV